MVRFGCACLTGDCPVGCRDSDNYCLHEKYCSAKVRIEGNVYIVDSD